HFSLLCPPPLGSTLFPYTTLFRSLVGPAAWRRWRGRSKARWDDCAHPGCPERVQTRSRCGCYGGPWSRIDRYKTAEPCKRICLRSEEHTSELQSRGHLVCRLLLEK